ncbi:hypothetical protein ANCCAN_00739 [Ancylostoma caninum]|uniref:Uncharacterized protein n=1 Tax=Ancylostoma caninum TaxID=29170 RepID=A0A368HD82_ANCCA|nr:hypothetical protein ANCCAN_00739 [Ancylostoma caninum]
MVLSVIQPAPLDYGALPPGFQSTLKGTSKEGGLDQLNNSKASAEKGSSIASAETTPKNLKASEVLAQSYGVADRPASAEKVAYGVADRPPSIKKPMVLQQSYGVADRPGLGEKATYGVVDRPASIKKPTYSQQSYGVADRPGSAERVEDNTQMQKQSSQKLSLSGKAPGKASGAPGKQQQSLAARVEALKSAAAARKPLVDESSSSSQNRNANGNLKQQEEGAFAESIRLYDRKLY